MSIKREMFSAVAGLKQLHAQPAWEHMQSGCNHSDFFTLLEWTISALAIVPFMLICNVLQNIDPHDLIT